MLLGPLVAAIIAAFNAIIVAIAAIAVTFIALLPPFPSPPDPPDDGVLGWIGWIFPLGAMLSVFAAMVTCWIVFLGLKVVLRWVKAL